MASTNKIHGHRTHRLGENCVSAKHGVSESGREASGSRPIATDQLHKRDTHNACPSRGTLDVIDKTYPCSLHLEHVGDLTGSALAQSVFPIVQEASRTLPDRRRVCDRGNRSPNC
jgi:hypothetical protein